MKALLVEDDENKRQQLSLFLRETYESIRLTMERSLQSGLRRIKAEPFDLIILDMTLPTYDASPDESGGPTQPLGGREFLRQMDRFDITVPVIVVTQFVTFGKGPSAMSLADLDRSLKSDHRDYYLGTVYYHAAIQGWQDGLRQFVDQFKMGRSI